MNERKLEPRKYELLVAPFACGEIEHLRVYAQNRGSAFTLAAIQASDSQNVWKITLVRDNGRLLDPMDVEEHNRVPAGWTTPLSLSEDFGGAKWWMYDLGFELFGGVEADEGAPAIDRADAFTGGVINSTTPDDIRCIWLRSVCNEMDRVFEFDPRRKYGGVTFDLVDSRGVSDSVRGESADGSGGLRHMARGPHAGKDAVMLTPAEVVALECLVQHSRNVNYGDTIGDCYLAARNAASRAYSRSDERPDLAARRALFGKYNEIWDRRFERLKDPYTEPRMMRRIPGSTHLDDNGSLTRSEIVALRVLVRETTNINYGDAIGECYQAAWKAASEALSRADQQPARAARRTLFERYKEIWDESVEPFREGDAVVCTDSNMEGRFRGFSQDGERVLVDHCQGGADWYHPAYKVVHMGGRFVCPERVRASDGTVGAFYRSTGAEVWIAPERKTTTVAFPETEVWPDFRNGEMVRVKNGSCAPFAGYDAAGRVLVQGPHGLNSYPIAEVRRA